MRPFDIDKDYATICAWHRSHGWPELPKDGLSSIGFIDDHCAGFLYTTNSCIAWVEFVVGNPDSDSKIRSKSLDLLFFWLKKEAEKLGFKMLFSSGKNPAYERRLLDHGWVHSDSGVNHYIKSLHGDSRIEVA
jgi:hypothetical protein